MSWASQRKSLERVLETRHPTFIYPRHISPLCLNTLVLQRKLSPYALTFLTPHQPHVVFWACLIIRETSESSVTWRVPGRTPSPSLSQTLPARDRCLLWHCGWAGGRGSQDIRLVFRLTCMSCDDRSRMGRAITALLTSSGFCF